MNVGELAVQLGFDSDDKKIDSFDQKIQGLISDLNLSTVAFGAAIYALDRLIESAVRGATAIYNFNQQTGLSADKLQQWQAAAHLSNIALSTDEVASSIQGLENNLLEIRKFGAGNASPFAFLGIDIGQGQNAFDVLDQLRDKLQRVDRITAVNLIQKMGLSPGFINILTKSKEEFDKLIEGMRRSDSTVLSLEKLGESVAMLQYKFMLFKDELIANVAPGIVKAFEFLGQVSGRMVEDFKALIEEFPTAAKAIAGGIILITAALNPMLTLLTGIIALLDDLQTYKRGGDSFIGRLLDKFDKNQAPEGAPTMNWLDKLLGADNYKPNTREITLDDIKFKGINRSDRADNIKVQGGDSHTSSSVKETVVLIDDSQLSPEVRAVIDEQRERRRLNHSYSDFSGAGQ